MVAVNLARMSERPLHVVLINSSRPLGRGTAYGTRRAEHLLNVVARNMSAFPDMPSHFVDWLGSRSDFSNISASELREIFAPRRVYGDYIRGMLEACLHPIDARCQVKIEPVDAEALDVSVVDGKTHVSLDNGQVVDADQIVLATGNQAPAAFPSSSPLRHDPRYRSDPWSDWLSRLPPPGGSIVLLGAGLTMVDIVLTLAEIGWDGEIVAVSRNGMLPKSHFRGIAYEEYLPDNAESLGLAGLRELVGQHCERLKQMSQNSAIAVDKLRPHTQRLWRSLSTDEKRDFLNHDAAIWNVVRHRVAVSVHNKITDALDSGRLRVVPGLIEQLVPGEQQIEVLIRDSQGVQFAQAGDLVINCTGPQARLSKAGLPLFDNLLSKSLVCSDDLDMGIRVDDDFAALQGDGQPSSSIYAIGPLLKGRLVGDNGRSRTPGPSDASCRDAVGARTSHCASRRHHRVLHLGPRKVVQESVAAEIGIR